MFHLKSTILAYYCTPFTLKIGEIQVKLVQISVIFFCKQIKPLNSTPKMKKSSCNRMDTHPKMILSFSDPEKMNQIYSFDPKMKLKKGQKSRQKRTKKADKKGPKIWPKNRQKRTDFLAQK